MLKILSNTSNISQNFNLAHYRYNRVYLRHDNLKGKYKLNKERNSNIELLRIISMVMIVAHHLAIHSTWTFDPGFSVNKFTIEVLSSLGKIGVNIYFMITGYYMIQSHKSQTTKIKKIWLQVLFYSLTILCLFLLLHQHVSMHFLIFSLFPVFSGLYWFATVYIIILLFLPFINNFLNSLSKESFLKLLLLSSVVFLFVPTFFIHNSAINITIIALLAYSYGAFFQRFDLPTIILSKMNIIALFSVLAVTFSILLFEIISSKIIGLNGKEAILFTTPQSFVAMIFAVYIFNFFKQKKPFTLKIINTMSATSFGVYLIHDNGLIREYLWNSLNLTQYLQSVLFIPLVFIIILTIYICCSLIDLCRNFIFNMF
ncbi:acyltransferase family protein [Dellaglioa sp. P0083]|uniref:acyltransferase family protein n=1 Tax=Dellaglioa kimchii TaxID=3344667 RepID=UPI0038D3F461